MVMMVVQLVAMDRMQRGGNGSTLLLLLLGI